MRRLSAILLISIFSFSLYARQLSYLGCQFSNTFKTGAAKCDCEKKAGFDKQGSDLPAPLTHTHLHPDEFYSGPGPIIIAPGINGLSVKLNHYTNDRVPDGIYPTPWQPPTT